MDTGKYFYKLYISASKSVVKTVAYSEPCFQLLTIYAYRSIIHTRQDSEYTLLKAFFVISHKNVINFSIAIFTIFFEELQGRARQDFCSIAKCCFECDICSRKELEEKCPAGSCIFKVNNKNTRTRCEICSQLTIKTPESCHWLYC